jgi:hypothetical protein
LSIGRDETISPTKSSASTSHEAGRTQDETSLPRFPEKADRRASILLARANHLITVANPLIPLPAEINASFSRLMSSGLS